jgi:hypothetical protein
MDENPPANNRESPFRQAALNKQNPKWKRRWGNTPNPFCGDPTTRRQGKLRKSSPA